MLRTSLPRIFVWTVIAAGAAAVGTIALTFGLSATEGQLIACLTLALGVMLGELFPVRIGGDAGEVAFSSTFTFALLLGWGPGPALAAQLGACLVAALLHRAKPLHAAFNLAQYALAVAAATGVLEILRDHQTMHAFNALDLLEASVAAGAFFVVNTGLVSAVVALHADVPIRDQFRDELRMQTGTEGILLGMAPLALLGVQNSPALALLLALPLLAVQRAGSQAVDNERLALQDSLTGLANRTCLTDRSQQALARARRDGSCVAVVLIDLDRFKDINDTLGHEVGDHVLCTVAERIRATVREVDTVARLGGDEFAVLLPDAGSPELALETARRIHETIGRPIEMTELTLEPSGSVGVACYPDDGVKVDELIRHADHAMYTAKEQRLGVAVYEHGDEELKLTQLKLAGRLGAAIAGGELELVYQPQVRPATGQLVGVEALVRWRHPQFGLLGPDRFIALAERSGHILALTLRVIDDALAQLARWNGAGLDMTMAVNLSADSLADAQLPGLVADACARAGVEPQRLVLEITEGMLLAEPERAIAIAGELAELGVGISVDDFGTGFSSLEQLVRLPAVELKIDRSFVGRMHEDSRAAAIVSCVADLADSLGLRLVGEGVECEEGRLMLEKLGCDLAQGYLWSRPLPPEALEAFALSSARSLQAA